MFELIGVLIGGMVIGGTIVEVFKAKIDADVATIVAAYQAEVAKVTTAHTAKTVAAITTPAAA